VISSPEFFIQSGRHSGGFFTELRIVIIVLFK
jgi:hypothetical protein